ncbi:hypothetical protein GCM10009823_24440 [Brevibacterium salitolerans]|mgnify:CR=1 FL=1|uniref:TadE-like protein n=1 Tax=Brevibacterium salitolerans TaxID=1403566 RepID=A0ABP5INS3_9MICO
MLLVPLVYLVIALAQVQAGAYAAQSTAIDAARQAARQPEGAAARAQALGELHFADHGLESARWTVELSCSGDCARAGSRVTAAVEARVPVPGVPQIWGGAHVPGITVRAEHTDVVSPEES